MLALNLNLYLDLSLSCCLLRQFARSGEANLLNDRFGRGDPGYRRTAVTVAVASSFRMLTDEHPPGTFVAEAVAHPAFELTECSAGSSVPTFQEEDGYAITTTGVFAVQRDDGGNVFRRGQSGRRRARRVRTALRQLW